ncbi:MULTISPECIES: class I SAM-dependent DNA methyltransferase [unclassified Simplicispira]|uniref:HsdM family class I SAM-dependent methyltransferase n=1 Tax=unclassified Simplicispira TaxID=2630407 RepID=UPI000D5F1E17|nr:MULTISPECIES: N-6 DNA methylase [unclassified Simplicispira]PVY57920.1 type I restriction-modification system DNA methylase subunit [Simplicispira sp. 125]REG18863.1 type I restriction-modification system DNA methylase subunit [Simplicispira sp. 110]
MSRSLRERLVQLGAAAENIVFFAGQIDTPLQYLDLVRLSKNDEQSVRPDCVIEVAGQPFLYVYDGSRVGSPWKSEEYWKAIKSTVASRADAPYVGVLTLEAFHVWQVEASHKPLDAYRFELANTFNPVIPALIQNEGSQFFPRSGKWLDERLFSLLWLTATSIREGCPKLTDSDVISLVGRGLFLRFLADRNYLERKTLLQAVDSSAGLAELFRWLDVEFNGNLLPIESLRYSDFDRSSDFTATVVPAFGRIMYGSMTAQLEFGWSDIRFQHVPVDLLSQVYEAFMHRYRKRQAKDKSVHYTPRRVAQLMVDQAFLGVEDKAHSELHVLDPAAGGGVFLVLAYKKIIEAHRSERGEVPNGRELRQILYRQIRGYDIDSDALKFAALSLYLTVLELEPEFAYGKSLPFEDLSNKCLFEMPDGSALLGSIGYLPPEGDTKFDLVIGNPPWTRVTTAANKVIEKHMSGIASRFQLLKPGSKVKNRRNAPDVAFLWMATQWAREGGIIAFAIHSRLFTRAEDTETRELTLRVAQVTGVVNGSLLRKSRVWPGVAAPFALLFAVNRQLEEDYDFQYFAPLPDLELNAQGLFRLDPQEAHIVGTAQLKRSPSSLKSLLRGSARDLSVVDKLRAATRLTVGSYWASNDLVSSDGYQLAGTSQDAAAILHWPNLTARAVESFSVTVGNLPRFDRKKVHRVRDPRTYLAPLLAVSESPPTNRDARPASLLCLSDMAYSESFVGYSASGLSDELAQDVVRWLHVLTSSSLALYWYLMTSAKFGVERDTILKEDIDSLPFVPPDRLTSQQRIEVRRLSASIERGECPWDEVDSTVARILKLSVVDRAVVSDTLASGLPFTENQRIAQLVPSYDELSEFCEQLERTANEVLATTKRAVRARPIGHRWSQSFGWRFVKLSFSGCRDEKSNADEQDEPLMAAFAKIAANFQTPRVIVNTKAGDVVVGMLAQRHFWTARGMMTLLAELFGETGHG